MFCLKCGTENETGARFCKNCGTAFKTKNTSEKQENYSHTENRRTDQKVQFESDVRRVILPDEYKPISMWGYFGYEILFSIPIVGLILLIVFSITAKNKNLKNFARSYFCFLIVLIVVLLVITLSAGAGLSRLL